MICNRCSEYIDEFEESYEGMCEECAADMLSTSYEDMLDDYEDAYMEDEDLLDWELERFDENEES